MSSDDDLDSGSFLTGTDEASGVSFPLASGIDAGAIGRAIIGSVGFTLALGATTIVDAWQQSVAGLITGFQEFIAGGTRTISGFGVRRVTVASDGLIDVTVGAGIAAIEGAWSFGVESFGLLAFPIAIGVLLATAFVVEQLVDLASEVL